MDRTWYVFDKRIDRKDIRLRLQIVVCKAPDCRLVMHCDKKRGQQKMWCSNRCYSRWRTRWKKQLKREQFYGVRKPRHKGVLGTAHYAF